MESSLIYNKKYYNLSEPQKIIFLSDSIYKGSCLNTVVTISNLKNHDNVDLLKEIIQEVISENPSLFINIDITEGVPRQYINPEIAKDIELIDFRSKSFEDESRWIKTEVERVYKLTDKKLFNFILFFKHDSSLNLLISMHHIICDAWSHQSLAKQIYDKYESRIKNQEHLSICKMSYLDYIKTENNYLISDRGKLSEEYWRKKFIDYKSLPPFFKRIDNSYNAKSKQLRSFFSRKIQNKILSICSDNKITFATFFLSSLLLCLNYISGNKKHLIGTLSYNRLGKNEKTAVGMFVNTLPLLFDLEKNINFNSIVKMVEIELAGLMKHQRYPLRYINNHKDLKQLNLAGNLDMIYSYQNIILPYEYTYHFNGYSAHPILFRPTRNGEDGDFFFDIDYQVDCFSESEIKRFSDIYINIIELLDKDLNKPINLKILYKEKIKEEPLSNDILTDIDELVQTQNQNLEQTLHRIFEKRATEFSENKAITFNNKSLTYYELNRKANYLATILLEKGAGNEKPVALILDRSLEMMISILAVLKTGSCYLPLATDLPISRINKILNLSGTKIVLHNVDINKDLCSSVISVDVSCIKYPETYIPNLHIDIKPNNLAYIIYTSGSTGEPKGVMIEHKSVINRLYWMQDLYPLYEDDVVMQKTPYTFDVSVWELFGWYLNGSVLHFLKPGAEKEPNTITEVIKNEKITIIHFVPSMLSLFLEYIDKYGSVDSIVTIRRVCCSGEALLLEHVNRFKKIINGSFTSKLLNLYGPTEATVEVSYFDCLNNDYDFIPIGKPINNVDLYVLDEKGKVLPPGEVGELFIGGVCLARGYFNKPELTNEKFVYNHYIGKRVYSSGDLATYLPDGNIKYLGRLDNQVKIRGNRVELGEIESCLLTFEGVLEAAVTAPTDEYGNSYLGAYFIAENIIKHEDLRHYLLDQLPSYMIPSYFIQMENFPLTSSGKLDRKALPELGVKTDNGNKYHSPINDREEEICEIWEDVLKLEKISRDDNFFQIGGDSLTLIQVLFPLQDKYDVTLQDLFEFQTIKDLSAHIHRRSNNKIIFKEDSYNFIINQRRCFEKIRKYQRDIDIDFDKTLNNFSNILLTGGTGFLGSYIIREFLDDSSSNLYLLVRGETGESAKNRVIQKLTYYFGPELYKKYTNRIFIIPGDITKERLGVENSIYNFLCSNIEAVIHCAANVKHFAEREEIYNINVNGTKNILSFCNDGLLKRINFVSTLSVGLNNVKQGYTYHFIENDRQKTDNRGNVYIDSKILAEELVLDNLDKLGGQIYRVGNIVNDYITGKFQENREQNAFYSLMNEYKNRGVAPNIDLPFIDLSYVDQTARVIKLLSNYKESGVFHVYNPNTLTIKDMCKPQDITIIEFKDFVNNIHYGDSILTHGYYLHNLDLLGFIPYNDKTNKILRDIGFIWGETGFEHIKNIWNNWG